MMQKIARYMRRVQREEIQSWRKEGKRFEGKGGTGVLH